jgi:hypothetical protein
MPTCDYHPPCMYVTNHPSGLRLSGETDAGRYVHHKSSAGLQSSMPNFTHPNNIYAAHRLYIQQYSHINAAHRLCIQQYTHIYAAHRLCTQQYTHIYAVRRALTPVHGLSSDTCICVGCCCFEAWHYVNPVARPACPYNQAITRTKPSSMIAYLHAHRTAAAAATRVLLPTAHFLFLLTCPALCAAAAAARCSTWAHASCCCCCCK